MQDLFKNTEWVLKGSEGNSITLGKYQLEVSTRYTMIFLFYEVVEKRYIIIHAT